jgi:O-antigen/teichoic acid export membrane protein
MTAAARDGLAGAPGPTSRPLTLDVGVTFGAKVAIVVLQVAGTVLIARKLGPTGRGAVAVALSAVLLLVQLGHLGLASANPFFGARERDRLASIVANSVLLAACLGGLLVLAGLGLRLVAPSALRGLSWLEVGLALAAVPAALLALLLQSILLGEGRMTSYNLIELGQNALILVALAIGLLALGMSTTGAIAVYAGGYLLAAGAYLWALREHPPRRRSLDLGLARRMLGYGLRVYLATLLGFLIIRLDLFLVNGLLGGRQAGLYAVAGSLADALLIFPMVVGLNLFPRVARGSAIETTAAVFRLVAGIYFVLVAASAALAGPVIGLLYGHAFHGAVSLYLVLSPGVLSMGLTTVLSNHFAGRGFPRQAMTVWVVGLAVNLALNIAFLKAYGTWVAAASSSVTYSLVLALHWRLLARETGSWRALLPRPREFLALARALAH